MDPSEPYETLDPENWEEMRKLAHRMVDDALTYLQTVRERPVWQPVPDEVAAHFDEKAPDEPGSAEEAYEEFKGDGHPIVVIAGRDIVDILKAAGYGDAAAVTKWL